MGLFGKAPVTSQLPFEWYNSPNVHFLTLKDFDTLCKKLGAKVDLQQGAKGNGKLVIGYNSLDELEGILSHIK